jgi:NAD(P)-dependent dehydrogenase (short-subunit alcohol dehydrogenase family)
MRLELKNSVVIVTGGGRGIGKGIALYLAQEGAKIVVFDIDGQAATEAIEAITSNGGQGFAIQGDVVNESQVDDLVHETLNRYGAIHILINNAGLGGGGLVENTTIEQWRRIIDVNLTGPFLCSRSVLPIMKQQRFGKIVNIASIAGERIGFWGGAHYAASKAGLLCFTRQLAFEVAPYGINVNAVMPGSTDTPLWRKAAGPQAELRTRLIPIGRLIQPNEIADAVAFLISDRARMITGVALAVDGGALLGWVDTKTYYDIHKKGGELF